MAEKTYVSDGLGPKREVKPLPVLVFVDELFGELRAKQDQNRVIHPGSTQTPFPLPAETIQPSQRPPQQKPALKPATVQTTPSSSTTPTGKPSTAGQEFTGNVGTFVGAGSQFEAFGPLALPARTAVNFGFEFAAKFPVKTLAVDLLSTATGFGISKTKIPSFRERLLFGFPAAFVFGELIEPRPAFTSNDEGSYFTTVEAEQARAQLASFVLAQLAGNTVPEPLNQPPTPPMWQADP